MVDVGDAAHQGIFHRDDAEVAAAIPHRFDRILETAVRQGLRMRDGFAGSEIGVGAGRALKSDAFGMGNRSGHMRIFRAKNCWALAKSSGVSTQSGTVSTRATAMLIFASSARSCSSFSRRSSGDG